MRFLPVLLLDHSPEAVFITNESGRIEYANSAAARILGCEVDALVGMPCREAGFRLQTPDGQPFCTGHGCPIHRMLLRGRAPERPIEVVLVRGGGSRANATLESFAISPPDAGGVAILHRLIVCDAQRASSHPAPALRDAASRLGKLSKRETEVLERLATGMQTDQIADTLFISHETVRNHVRHILDKLRVHHRIDAVVAWVAAGAWENARDRVAADPVGSPPDKQNSSKK